MSNSPTLSRRSQLGELLVAEGKLSREELTAALAYREERGLKLGQALVALHLVTQQDLAGALRSQGRVHCLNLTPGIVDPDVARLLPEAMARQYVALPVHRVAGRVTVAMEDPAEEYDVDAIAVALGEPIFPVHADPERILDAVERIYQGALTRQRAAPDSPRFTLVRGPLPESDPDEAAAKLVRAALREACAIGADSFHVESTACGTEMSFRSAGVRTPAAVLSADWADACARALVLLAGGSPDTDRAAGFLDLDGLDFEIEVVTLAGVLGRCARASIRPKPVPFSLEHLPLAADDRASILAWLKARGLLLVVGPASTGTDALARELGARAASTGRRVYRLAFPGEVVEGVVAVARRSNADLASELGAIGDQRPDVVEVGRITGRSGWRAAMDLARLGALVIACVDEADGASAVAAILRAVDDPALVANACVGAVSLREVRLACAICRSIPGESSGVPTCAHCGSTGISGATRIAEALDLRGPLREHVERDIGAPGLRSAAESLGIETLESRGRDLVRRGLTSEREVRRAEAGWTR